MGNPIRMTELLRRPSLRFEIERERAARSLREFVRQAWHVIEPSALFVPGFHIDAIIDQNPEFETRTATETMARFLGRLEGEASSVITSIQIYTPENA